MKITYSEDADAMYIQLNDRAVARTQPITDTINMDFDQDGEIRGLELIAVAHQVTNPFEVLYQYAQSNAATEFQPPSLEDARARRLSRKAPDS